MLERIDLELIERETNRLLPLLSELMPYLRSVSLGAVQPEQGQDASTSNGLEPGPRDAHSADAELSDDVREGSSAGLANADLEPEEVPSPEDELTVDVTEEPASAELDRVELELDVVASADDELTDHVKEELASAAFDDLELELDDPIVQDAQLEEVQPQGAELPLESSSSLTAEVVSQEVYDQWMAEQTQSAAGATDSGEVLLEAPDEDQELALTTSREYEDVSLVASEWARSQSVGAFFKTIQWPED